MDTHTDTLYAMLSGDGHHLGTEAVPNTAAGRSCAITWVGRRTGGDTDAFWVVEGAESYGAQWARNTSDTGYRLVEAARMNDGCRGVAKFDPLDGRRIAATVL